MFDQSPEYRGFEFRSGFVVNCHDRDLARYLTVSREDIDIKWELSQILPYRSAKRAQMEGISATQGLKQGLKQVLKTSPRPLTALARSREIINELI
jgi:hypothetical protein